MNEPKILLPNPSRLIEGLRDTGYDFNMSLADLTDNSVDAKATAIDVNVEMDFDGEVSVQIADNGCGMNLTELENAMTYGSVSNKDASSLGKFGLGLKTASTAFCRRLSVITRSAKDKAVYKAIWDLDHVEDENKWEMLFEEPRKDELEILNRVTDGSSGTLVTWEKVDRLMKEYKVPGCSHARKALAKRIEEFRHHAGTVYQRNLNAEDDRTGNIKMTLNGEAIPAWDPFCENENHTQVVAEDTIPVDLTDGGEAQFHIKAYILPRKEGFSSPDAHKEARLSNDNQGMYIYRENRLIHRSDWLGMFRQEPHFTLLRIEFSFDHKLDEAFNVDIKKSRILLNDELFNFLRKFVGPPRNAAEEQYRKGQKKKVGTKAEGGHKSSDNNLKGKESDAVISEIDVVDAANNEVNVTNKQGTFRIKMPVISPSENGNVMIKTSAGIDDGMLWEPCVIDQHHSVNINTGHDYYRKVYVPNLSSGVTVQGMDSLLWALCEAELGTINDKTKKYFRETRYEVSRILRLLVEDLPEPDLGEDDE